MREREHISAMILRLTTQRLPRPDAVLLVVVGAVLAAIHGSYVCSYFFLFDDFALVGQASSAHEIFSRSLFGFYRPMVFLSVRIETALFSWSMPAGYMAVSQLWHVVNALLVSILLKQFGQSRRTAVIGGFVCLLSPWSSEAYFWLSARFDVLAVFGVLATLVLGLAMIDASSPGTRLLMGAAGLAAAAIGLFAKENCVVLPALAPGCFLAARGREILRRFSPWIYCALLTALTGLFLVVRNRLLPGLGGAYGDAATLFAATDVLKNALSYGGAFINLPFPGILPGQSPPVYVVVAFTTLFVILLGQAWRANRGLVLSSVIGFALTVAPVLWIGPLAGSSAAGRLRYLPGVWVAMLVATGLGRLAAQALNAQSRRKWLLYVGALALVIVPSIVSVRHQAGVWTRATTLAREAIDQFRPMVDQGLTQVYVPNLPFWFAEGPYVLKGYAFEYYFSGRRVPTVRTRDMVVTVAGERTRFSGWVDSELPAQPAPGERVLRLTLPISGQPSALTLNGERFSVFITRDGKRSSDATVSVLTTDGGTWQIENPAPEILDIEPSQGSGPLMIRVAARRNRTAFPEAREVLVPIRTGSRDSNPDVTFRVSFKVVSSPALSPPFGSVDAPPNPVSISDKPVVFQGWAADDFDFRGVTVEADDSHGGHVILGNARQVGMRPDVARLYPNAHDVYNAAWVFTLEPAALGSLIEPITLRFYARDGDGLRAEIGERTLKRD